jgi:hypothetical protein
MTEQSKFLREHIVSNREYSDRLGVCRREESSHVESTTCKSFRLAKWAYVVDSTFVDIFIPTDS